MINIACFARVILSKIGSHALLNVYYKAAHERKCSKVTISAIKTIKRGVPSAGKQAKREGERVRRLQHAKRCGRCTSGKTDRCFGLLP